MVMDDALHSTWTFVKGRQMQRCPDCDEPINSNAISIEEGVALCPACGAMSRLSELSMSELSVQEILSQQPSGCSITAVGNGVHIIASLRSIVGFLGATFIALFWNGIVSVFVLLAMAGLYTNLIGPLPAWFPAPGVEQGKPIMNDEPMGLGITLFLCIFLIPFVTIGVGMIGAALMSLCGKVEVALSQYESYVATGIGFIKWKRRFDPQQVRSVTLGNSSWSSGEGEPTKAIELQADHTIQFGSMLREERMIWLRTVLKSLLMSSQHDQNAPVPPLPWLNNTR